MHLFTKIFLFINLVFLSLNADAQVYYQVTDTSGTQNVGGNSVSISHSGASCPRTGSICGQVATDYCISACGTNPAIRGAGTWTYNFANAVSGIKLYFSSVNADDTIQVVLNSIPYTISGSQISQLCSNPGPYTTIYNGLIVGTNISSNLFALTIQPAFNITAVSVSEYTTATNNSGFYYSFYFVNTCPGGISITPQYDTICAGAGVQYIANTNSVSSAASYSWSGPNGFTSSSQNVSLINLNLNDSGNYILSISDTGNCVYTGQAHLVVKPLPTIQATYNAPLCTGDSLKLNANAGSGTVCNWTGPTAYNALGNTVTRPNITTSDTGYYVVNASLNNCAKTDSIFVEIGNHPNTPQIVSNSPICAGDTLKLDVNNVQNGVNYHWMGPSNYNSTLAHAVRINSTSLYSGIYKLIANQNGCADTVSLNASISNLVPAPGISIQVSHDTICLGDDVLLTSNINNSANTVYQWRKNGIAFGPNAASFSYNAFNNGDVVSCKINSTMQCQYVDSGISNSKSMNVLYITPPIVNLIQTPASYIPGATISFSTYINNPPAGLSFSWEKNGVNINGANSPVYTTNNLSLGDSICVVVHCAQQCTVPDSVVACKRLTEGIKQVQNKPISVYPNPVENELWIAPIAMGTLVTVYNVVGEKILSCIANTTPYSINTALWPKGTYLLHIANAGGREIVRVVK